MNPGPTAFATVRRVFACVFAVALLPGLALTVQAQPVFTGDAAADFGALPGSIKIVDTGGKDVGVPALFNGTVSGFDMAAVYFFYDAKKDKAYFGVDCHGICGDADGDGDPGRTSTKLADIGGQDRADFSFSESVALILDTNGDFNATSGTGADAVIGVRSDAQNALPGSSIAGFGTYMFDGSALMPQVSFGPPLPNTTKLHAGPTKTKPDLEFTVEKFSELPGFDFTPGETFTFYMNAFTGSFEDAGIGEDYLPALAQVVPVFIEGAIDLHVEKSANDDRPYVGEEVTFTVKVINDGPDPATGVKVRDKLPPEFQSITHEVTRGTYEPATGVWWVDHLAKYQSATLTVRATPTKGGTYVNTAEVIAADQDDWDSTPDNNKPEEDDQASVSIQVKAAVDLELSKKAEPASAVVGDAVRFTVTLTNKGPEKATRVKVKDELPDGLAFEGAVASAGDYDKQTGLWTLNALAAGQAATLELKARVKKEGTFTNTAEVVAADQKDSDSTPNNHDPGEDDQASATVATKALIDLELAKVVDHDHVQVGNKVTFTLKLVNKGPSKATGVKVQDVLPAGLQFVSASATHGGYDKGTGFWTVGTLDAYQQAKLDVTVRVEWAGTFTNTAEVFKADQKDTDSAPGNGVATEDDQASATVKTDAPKEKADLSLRKSVSHAAPNPGDHVSFTILVKNHGPDAATGVKVKDVVPYGLTFVSASASQGSYEASTGIWAVGSLGDKGTATLTIKTRVDRDPENCAEIVAADQDDPDSTPNNHDRKEDDMHCVVVTIGNTSGGGNAGIESDGSMATQLAQRLFHRRQDAQMKRALRATPAPVPFVEGMSATFAPGPGAGKTTVTDIGSFIPETGPQETRAHVVTPVDLLGVTNATSVFAADYLRPEGRRLAALFGATSPAGVLYDHAKETCDRLGGGRLDGVETIEIGGHPFVLSHLVHPDGSRDFSVSFVAYETHGGFVVDSRFAHAQYEVAPGTNGIVNLQVWSVSPEYTAELVAGVLDRMAAEGTVTYLNTPERQPVIPDVYVRDGRYSQGRLSLRIVNRTGATTAVVRGTIARTERDADDGVRVPFEQTVALPAPADGSDYVSVDVEVGPIYDATFQVEHAPSRSLDQVYYADGVWSYGIGERSAVTTFETYAEEAVETGESRYAVERDAYLSGHVNDWVSLFRYLRPGGQPVDLSRHAYVEFTAYGQGRVHFVAEKASIDSWDQYGHAFTLNPEPRTYRIYFDELTRTGGAGGFTAEDVTLLVFYVNGQSAGVRFDLVVKDVTFGGATSVAAEDEPAGLPRRFALGQNYPNPFNPATHIAFDLPVAVPVRLAVFDVLGREIALLADGLLAAGRHEVRFDAADLPSGTYLYRLDAAGETVTKAMVLMK